MFTDRLPSRDASAPAHIARMIAVLGSPPKDLLKRGQFSALFFDEDGGLLQDAVGRFCLTLTNTR
jgi:serine/threonine-protein kinase SRPK3